MIERLSYFEKEKLVIPLLLNANFDQLDKLNGLLENGTLTIEFEVSFD